MEGPFSSKAVIFRSIRNISQYWESKPQYKNHLIPGGLPCCLFAILLKQFWKTSYKCIGSSSFVAMILHVQQTYSLNIKRKSCLSISTARCHCWASRNSNGKKDEENEWGSETKQSLNKTTHTPFMGKFV